MLRKIEKILGPFYDKVATIIGSDFIYVVYMAIAASIGGLIATHIANILKASSGLNLLILGFVWVILFIVLAFIVSFVFGAIIIAYDKYFVSKKRGG